MVVRTARRLLIPALSTGIMLAILLGLGTWQVQRLAWKRGLLAQFALAEQNPPVPLRPGLPQFAKVTVSGRLRPDLAAFYGAEVRGEVLGTQLLMPLERTAGPPLLVDLGWIPNARRSGVSAPGGEVGITGYLRPGEHPGWFSAPDNAAMHEFYTLDPPVIAAALHLAEVAPVVLVAMGDAPAAGGPDPARHLPVLPNNHLQYAITWYGLAAVLLVVFVVYVRKGVAHDRV